MKKALNIPSITESLRSDVEIGKITLEDAASELNRSNLTPYIVDAQRAAELLHINNPMCHDCVLCGNGCTGTTVQAWTGCVNRITK